MVEESIERRFVNSDAPYKDSELCYTLLISSTETISQKIHIQLKVKLSLCLTN
jgi:hypothetical protein